VGCILSPLCGWDLEGFVPPVSSESSSHAHTKAPAESNGFNAALKALRHPKKDFSAKLLDNLFLTVTGKGRKQRIIPFSMGAAPYACEIRLGLLTNKNCLILQQLVPAKDFSRMNCEV